MSDVNKIAEEFLKSLTKGTSYAEERLTPTSISDPFFVSKSVRNEYVALKREEGPHFFVGFKKCGKPVFTYDLKLAKSFEIKCLTMVAHIGKLSTVGIDVVPHDTNWHEGRKISE